MIRQQAQFLDSKARPAAQPCHPHVAPTVATQDCSHTQVKGLLGTG